MIHAVGDIVGRPFTLEVLKIKPGRRRTVRAQGPISSAIVKLYASDRATLVARRVAALAGGPPEPVLPTVLHVDASARALVLSEVGGRPLADALLRGDLSASVRAGAALGGWHAAWQGTTPDGLRLHTLEREIEILRMAAAKASMAVARAVVAALPASPAPWSCQTVVHRDLYEEQVLVGERIGLIDLDDAALGPPELDVANLIAHVELLERRREADLRHLRDAILEGYLRTGPALDRELLGLCRALSLLRLACLNDDPQLVELALDEGVPV